MSESFGLWFGGTHIGFGSHLPALAAAVMTSRPGPVLEYGLGFYSTPLLHMLCEATGRKLLSLEGDAPWGERFMDLSSPIHSIVSVPSWEASEPVVDEFSTEWSVVFIDHGPDERRLIDARRLANRAEFVVIHDWGEERRDIAELFEHLTVTWGSTAVASNVKPFAGLDLSSAKPKE